MLGLKLNHVSKRGHCSITSSIDSMYGYSAADFIGFFKSHFICYLILLLLLIIYIHMIHTSYLLFVMKDVYVFEWYYGQLFSNYFELACFLGLKYLESVQIVSEQVNNKMLTRWKPSSILEWAAISTLQDIEWSCFFYFLGTENL